MLKLLACRTCRTCRPASPAVATLLLACAGLAVASACSTPPSSFTASAGIVRTADSISFPVEGMACPNCAKEIEHALGAVPGVTGATVNFNEARATVTLAAEHPATLAQLQAAVKKWHTEHFTQEEDPDCLDPERRKELLKQQS